MVYFAFDLLYLDGYDLRGAPLADRRELLETVVAPGGVLRISEVFPGAGEEMLEAARENGLEGIVAKHASSTYESRRSREWLKIKIVGEQEFVIGGFTAPQGGAIISARWCWASTTTARCAGRATSAPASTRNCWPLCTRACSRSITEAARSPSAPSPIRGITWVKPELVCQVKFANWTPDHRLRAPVFLGLRNDMPRRRQARPRGAAPRPAPCWPTPRRPRSQIDGRTLKFTNLKKIFYPGEGYTKRDVLNYYDGVADLILPHLKDRPLSLKRYPNGIRSSTFFRRTRPIASRPGCAPN